MMKYKIKIKHAFPVIVIFLIIVVMAIVLHFGSTNDFTDNGSEFSLLFLGDFMIGDTYGGSISYPFEGLKVMFEDKNDIIVNLETAVTDKNITVNSDKQYTYKINESVLGELNKNNVTILNLANNHILDFGVDGLNDTLLKIQKYNLSYFGADQNETQARKGIVRCYENSTTVGYLGYFEYRQIYDYNYHFYAKENTFGVATLNKTILESDILRMKETVDVVIVSLHIGKNYVIDISDEHKEFARYAIDVGADAVVCH